jgi:large subunit ribosomal protein L18
MFTKQTSKQLRVKRLPRIRKVLKGTADRPRITVFKSHQAISVQAIDDTKGTVMFSSRGKGKNIPAAIALGKEFAAHAVKKGIKKILFDRSGYRYHGAVKALADAIREGGIQV